MGDAAEKRTPALILHERAKLAVRMSQLDVELAETIGDSGAVVANASSLLTVEQFCEAVGMSRSTFFALIHEGLPAPLVPKLGRRIDLEQGRAWMVARGMKNAKEKNRGKRSRRPQHDVAGHAVDREVPDGRRRLELEAPADVDQADPRGRGA